MKELFVDNFAGGGGASTGIEMAIGRSVDIAINHDPDAIGNAQGKPPRIKALLRGRLAGGPCRSLCRKPRRAGVVFPGLQAFLPRKRRKAGGQKHQRIGVGSGQMGVRGAPKVLMLENVPEIQTWGPLGADGMPIKERAGETSRALSSP